MTLNKYDVLLIEGLIRREIDHHNYKILGEELFRFGDKSTKKCKMLQNDIDNMKTTIARIKGESK